MLQRKILSLSNLSLFESETIFSWKNISERKKLIIVMDLCLATLWFVVCGSMVGENRRSPASTETPVSSIIIIHAGELHNIKELPKNRTEE